jgi:hypothetical protein
MAKEISYIKTIIFKFEPSLNERESIVSRAIIKEQNEYNKLRWIVVEKDMKKARIKFFRKETKKRLAASK